MEVLLVGGPKGGDRITIDRLLPSIKVQKELSLRELSAKRLLNAIPVPLELVEYALQSFNSSYESKTLKAHKTVILYVCTDLKYFQLEEIALSEFHRWPWELERPLSLLEDFEKWFDWQLFIKGCGDHCQDEEILQLYYQEPRYIQYTI